MIAKTIYGEKSEKKRYKKNTEKMCKEKETILKGARGEELIELRWQMTKVIKRNSLGN